MNPPANPRIGIIFPPEFWRLPLEIGAAHRYFCEQQKRGLPTPYVFIGSSAGGIAATCSVAWTESNFTYLCRLIRDLTPGQIYKSTLRDKLAVTFLAADSLFHLFVSSEKSWWKKGVIVSGSLFAKIAAFYELLDAPSIFSPKPLFNLLEEKLGNSGFEAIFNSPVRLEILTMDKETREKIVYTNYLKADQTPERLIDGLAGTSALPLIFPCRKDGEKLMVDGAVHPLNTMPFYRVLENDCDIAVVLQFAPFNDKDLAGSTAGLKVVSQCFNITTSEIGSILLRGFINRNQDLEAKQKIEILTNELETLVRTKRGFWGKLGLSKQDELSEKLNDIRQACSEFSFTEMKSVKTLVVTVKDPKLLPPLSIHRFKHEEMARMLDLGYEAMEPVLDELEKLIKENSAL